MLGPFSLSYFLSICMNKKIPRRGKLAWYLCFYKLFEVYDRNTHISFAELCEFEARDIVYFS